MPSDLFRERPFLRQAIATQAHPRNKDTIVTAQKAVEPMRARLRLRGRTPIKCMPTVNEGGDVEEGKMRRILLQLLSPAEQVLALLASSNRLLTLFLRLSKRHSPGISSVSTPMIPSY